MKVQKVVEVEAEAVAGVGDVMRLNNRHLHKQ